MLAGLPADANAGGQYGFRAGVSVRTGVSVSAVKVLFGNRYEHFEANSETTFVDDRELQVFVWTRCTYVAE